MCTTKLRKIIPKKFHIDTKLSEMNPQLNIEKLAIIPNKSHIDTNWFLSGCLKIGVTGV
jgi:hypothetical protein